MEFDKSKVFTVLNASEVKIGSKGYFADELTLLKERVSNKSLSYYGELTTICPGNRSNYCFEMDNISNWLLFYPVEKPREKKFRPYRDSDEMIEDFKKRFNVKVPPYEMPLIWIKMKDTDKKYLVVRFASTLTICHNDEVYTPTFEYLVKGYTYLDGSPCGIEED